MRFDFGIKVLLTNNNVMIGEVLVIEYIAIVLIGFGWYLAWESGVMVRCKTKIVGWLQNNRERDPNDISVAFSNVMVVNSSAEVAYETLSSRSQELSRISEV